MVLLRPPSAHTVHLQSHTMGTACCLLIYLGKYFVSRITFQVRLCKAVYLIKILLISTPAITGIISKLHFYPA